MSEEAITAISNWKGRGIGIVDLAGGSLGSACRCGDRDKAARRIDDCLGDIRASRHRVQSGCIGALVRSPEGARAAMRNTPGVHQDGVGDGGEPRDVRDEVRLNIGGSPKSVDCQRRQAESNQGSRQNAIKASDRCTLPVLTGHYGLPERTAHRPSIP